MVRTGTRTISGTEHRLYDRMRPPATGIVLYPGVAEMLDRLDSMGVVCGIVTHASAARSAEILSVVGLTGRPAVVISGNRSMRHKPHPDLLLAASSFLGVPPAECVYVGDQPNDLRAAASAGMGGVPRGKGPVFRS